MSLREGLKENYLNSQGDLKKVDLRSIYMVITKKKELI